MAYENLCMYCFEDRGGQATCPHCGRDNHAAVPQIQMLPGTLVYHDRFLIGRALGQDATGIVYAALDTKKENKLRIREYLPRDCAERLNDGGVVPIAGLEDKYDAGIRKLRASVEDEEDPRRRHFFFEENGTAYIVQRRSNGASAQANEDEGRRRKRRDEDEGGRGRTVIIALIAAIAVVGAAAALFMVFGGNLLHPKDVTETPTMDPGQVWLPSDSPTVTPNTSPTVAALGDPDLSWMDDDYQTIDLGGAAPTANNGGTAARTATARPTATPKPTPAPTLTGNASGYTNINTRSGASEIRQLQQRLVTLGWLDYTKITGKYDADTRAAVRDFQRYINNSYNPATRLQVDGMAGPKTQQWLYQVNAARPTATPTPRPTATPRPRVTAPPDDDTVVDENSSAKKIRAMQRELILLGVLPEGTDNGKYDATTRSAVKRFQNRVNQLQGYEVLDPTGRMDALSMAFLDYYVDEWRAIQTATATPEPAATATPTPTPTPTTAVTPTAAPTADVVNGQSSPEAILEVQRSLIAIGMLPEGSGTGVYDGTTRAAVAAFQQWVNQRRGEQTLSTGGEADLLTRTYIKYCQDNGLRPGVAVTPSPTAQVSIPTDTPQPTPEVIDRNSSAEAIRRVQQLLADVGLLRSVDGKYGRGTQGAVRAFQEYVNAHGGSLEVTGAVDSATLSELERYAAAGLTADGSADVTEEPVFTAEPTEAPTPVPTVIPADTEPPYMDDAPGGDEEVNEDVNVTIDEGSEEESIRYVQMMLSNIGALNEDDITGIYDAATREAVARFQGWVNSRGAAELDVTGTVDDNTRRLLEYASDNELRMEGAPEQTEQTEQPGEAPVTGMSIVIDGQQAGADPVTVGDERFTVQWSAEGKITGYNVYVFNGAGDVIISRLNTRDTSFKVSIEQMIPGEIYTLTVGAIPQGGTEDDILWQTTRFVRPVQATPEPTATPEPRPSVGAIKAPKIVISGGENHDGVTLITEESFRIAWNAEGEVAGYDVRIVDAEGNEITSQTGISQTEISIRSGSMQSGMVYTISVGAVPVNGGSESTLWSRASFMRPALITPEPTAAPTFTPEPTTTPEPVVTHTPAPAQVGRPSVNVGGSGYQQDGLQYMTDSTIIISWVAEGDVASYIIYVENQSGERLSLGTTTDTSRTVTTSSLPAGVYTVYIGAVPFGGTQEDAQWGTARFGIPAAATPEPQAEVTREPDYNEDYADYGDYSEGGDAVPQTPGAETESIAPISADTDSDTVLRLQRQLYRLGVMAGEPEQGVLDSVTLQAVAEFQSRANDQYDAGLMVIDPRSPNAVIDTATLTWIAKGL